MIIKKTVVVLVLTILVLSGCVTGVSHRGSLVSMVDDLSKVKECKFIGIVVGRGSLLSGTATQSTEGGINDVRNKAAKLGADTILIDNIKHQSGVDQVIGVQSKVVGKAYKCRKSGTEQKGAS